MNNRSRSTLFLIEQLIVIAVFAICAAACAKILTAAFFDAKDSRAMSNAIHIAESSAESFKATGGNIGKVAEIMGGVSGSENGKQAAIVYYDSHWHVCGKSDADYRLIMTGGIQHSRHPGLLLGELTVEKLTGEQIISFDVTVRNAGEVQHG